MRLVVLREISDDPDLRRQWNALVELVDKPQVFYTYEWALAVQRAYHATLQPLMILAYDDANSLCGVAPLATRRIGNQTVFLCATTGDYCDFLSEPWNRDSFISATLGELRRQGIGSLALANLPADSISLPALRHAASETGFHCFSRTAYVCAQAVLDRLQRGKDGRPHAPGLKRLRRFEKAMGQATPVRTEHRRSWASIEPVLPEFIEAHVARFLELGRISNLTDSSRRLFLEELAKLLSDKQWIVLTRMLAGDRVVAWHYGFQFRGSWFWYQPTFDSSVEKHWPGFCLLSQVIQDAIGIPGMTMLDLGLGSEAYKAKFANDSRETLYLTLHSSLLDHWKTILRYRIAEAVKGNALMDKRATAAREKIRGLRDRFRQQGAKGVFAWLVNRISRLFWSRDEVFFYDLSNPDPALLNSEGVALTRIDAHTLAAAAIQNADDAETMAYIKRCAHRLRTEPESMGFALTNAAGDFLHFTWSGPFEGFYWSELDAKLSSPTPGSMVMFDSWTPISQRGRGHYAPTLGRAVAKMQQQGKRSWGFSASTNTPSVRGLEKAGFKRSFSIFRYRVLWWQKIVKQNGEGSAPPRP